MDKGIMFHGKRIIKPGGYSSVDANALTPDRVGSGALLALVGTCLGGTPATSGGGTNQDAAFRTTSMSEALKYVRGGDLDTAIRLAFNPSPDVTVPGAGEVVIVRVGTATQASGSISTQLDLLAKDFGDHTNFIRHKVETGTVQGKKFTVQHVVDDSQEVLDNFGQAFSLQYVGASTYARLNFNRTTGVFKVEISADNSTWTTLLEYTVSNSPLNTLKGLIDTLDAHADLTCTYDRYADNTMPSTYLDTVVDQDIVTAYTVPCQAGALIHWINSSSTILEATAGASPTGTIANYGWVNLASGSNGSAATGSDWTNALTVLESISDVELVYITSSDASVHSALSTHLANMSSVVLGKNRIGIAGGLNSDSVSDTITRAVNLNDARVTLAYPGIKRYNTATGALDQLTPALSAAVIAGILAGSNPEEPITRKTINAQGLYTYLSDTDIETLLLRGVTPFEFDPASSSYRIVQGITTWQKDGNVIFRKPSGMRIFDTLARELKATADRFAGKVTDATGQVSLRSAVSSKLDALTRSDQNPTGILTKTLDANGNTQPSWKNLTIVYDGLEWTDINVECFPVGEQAYVTITSTLLPSKMAL